MAGKQTPDLWHGPARIVLVDLPSTLWLSYQGGIIKASPERVRPASEEEQLSLSGWLEGLTKAAEDFARQPRRGFIDLTDELLPEFEHEEFTEDEELKHPGDKMFGPHLPVERVRAKTTPSIISPAEPPGLPEPEQPEQPDLPIRNTIPGESSQQPGTGGRRGGHWHGVADYRATEQETTGGIPRGTLCQARDSFQNAAMKGGEAQ